MKKGMPSETKGRLYVVATPIGNLGDLTFRALETLREVSFIACEDTRQTLKLMNRYELRKRLVSYYQPREKQQIPYIIRQLQEGLDVALVSDAGTPGISDPGFPLIKKALEEGIPVIPIPGVSAATAALSVSGLSTHKFLYCGFPPVKKGSVKKMLESLTGEDATLIFYLPPRRLESFLQIIEKVMPEREMVIARELTKLHEEFLRGTPGSILSQLKPVHLKGEATVLISGKTRQKK